MADHLDSSTKLTSPNGDPKADITDIYIFQKPGDDDKSILILNVNPLAPTLANEFQHGAVYDMLIDTDSDARADIGFRITFSPKDDGKQWAKVVRTNREHSDDEHDGESHQTVIENAPVSFGKNAHVTGGEDDDYRFFAGLRSDPFFFDLLAFLGPPPLNFHNPGSDFFIDKNVFGIVLEVPNREGLGKNSKIGYWARTLIPKLGDPDDLIHDDQMGRPAINTVFNHGTDKDLFNVTPPDKQASTITKSGMTFKQNFQATLTALGGSPALADVLLPDILTYDYSSSAGFLNGRKLTDDVIDAELQLVTGNSGASDFVGPHTDYLNKFPYLGTPH
jgi:hypothetical protein